LTCDRQKGAFVVEYAGELTTADEHYRREEEIAAYLKFFYYSNKHYWQILLSKLLQ